MISYLLRFVITNLLQQSKWNRSSHSDLITPVDSMPPSSHVWFQCDAMGYAWLILIIYFSAYKRLRERKGGVRLILAALSFIRTVGRDGRHRNRESVPIRCDKTKAIESTIKISHPVFSLSDSFWVVAFLLGRVAQFSSEGTRTLSRPASLKVFDSNSKGKLVGCVNNNNDLILHWYDYFISSF